MVGTKVRLVRWKWLAVGVGALVIAVALWLMPAIEQANSPGEKDFGVGILGGIAFFGSCALVPIGAIFVTAVVVEYLIQRRKLDRIPGAPTQD